MAQNYVKPASLGLFLLLGTIFASSMQAQEINGTIIDRKKEPITGASVTVVETGQNVISDLDGNFQVEAPEGSKLLVEYLGLLPVKKKAKEGMSVKMRDYKPFRVSLKAGTGITHIAGFDSHYETSSALNWQVGLGVEFALSKHWSIQPTLMLVTKHVKLEEGHNAYSLNFKPTYLQLPVLLAFRQKLSRRTALMIGGGAFLAYGVGGKISGYTMDGNHVHRGVFSHLFFNYLDTGVAAEIRYEFGRMFIDWDGTIGLFDLSKEYSEWLITDSSYTYSCGLSIGFRF